MAKHRAVHARSGLGRYTPPRRINPAHAAPAARGRLGRTAGVVIGGSALAAAGLVGLAGAPAGGTLIAVAGPVLPGSISIGPSIFGNFAGATATSFGDFAFSAAGGIFFQFNNSATSLATGPGGALAASI